MHTPYYQFLQQPVTLGNQFLEDDFLLDYLKTYLPEDTLKAIAPDLERFGERVSDEILGWARESENNPPQLTNFNAWGKRVDEIKVSQGWKNLEAVSAEEGLVAIGYERNFGAYSRLYQFVKLYLFTPSSAIFTCPLAMTDGAARLIEVYGDEFLKDKPFKNLTARDPKQFNTSGQWMTERTGGSDVSRSMTFAAQEESHYKLRGHKWFTSAITADMAFTLASTELPEHGKRAPLSLFYLPIRNEDGSLNGIEVEALKDKLGTKALPTAQLHLTGAAARLVGEKGKGVKTISTLFNITRIYNTISAVSYIRRAYALCKSYSTIREAFGKPIAEHLLYQKSLRELEIAYQSNTMLAFFLSQLLGKEECGQATSEDESLLRLLTPIAKLYTAKQSIKYASEHIEMFGGMGYLEDSGIPVMLRDAQVLSIWEGTTNVLSLDMLRAIEKEKGLEALSAFVKERLSLITAESLQEYKQKIKAKSTVFFQFAAGISTAEQMIGTSRDVAFYIAELTMAVLWLEFISKSAENESKYSKVLDYWLTYRLREDKLHQMKVLGLL